MPANAYLSLTSLSGTRPHAVPDDVRGFRREDPAGRCSSCRHHASFEGPAPATRYSVEAAVADVCLAYRRELLVARPTTRRCGRFEALPAPALLDELRPHGAEVNGPASPSRPRP
ncbi:hypothetical protein VP06_14310 [Methylobacterium aquaticum]|uniref:Uncharacterized protein n=1 Tax=Methylobacterium aquaticum TaxID=270351 RepID=A0A0J6SLB9_9HYPH|nr:hypothetical protein VP06_14310 [Methylobacterium aquaticum]